MSQDSSIATLAESLRNEARRLRPGDRLPSSRVLIERHRVSPVTVARALGLLAAEGLVETRPGSGTFVTDRKPPAEPPDLGWQAVALGGRTVDAGELSTLLTRPPDDTIPMGGGYLPPELQPLQALATAAARAARGPGAWERPPLNGIPELRAWFARTIGGDLTPADILISGGGQQAITIVLRALLAPGKPLLVESPTYLGVLTAARLAGLRPVPVPTDTAGLRPDLLAEAFAMTGARVLYCQPTFQNPTGVTLSAERRDEVLAVARAAGAFVVEDDFARHLAIDTPLPPLIAHDTDGRVVHISSLTKATSPSLRIAAVAARGPVAERVRAVQTAESFFPARPLQETALELVGGPGWPRHLRSLRTALRARRDTLVTALARELPQAHIDRPGGGMHLWARLPAGIDDVKLTEAALRGGVAVSPGRPYFPAEPTGPHLRLAYGVTATEAELVEGVRRLAAVLADQSY
ncbi:PLP-dependent aminotransferase family protein [Actinomadura craniellae]|uniref:PLP-dependent aminotransferase family protein n=1 Tax=Actinomadura craniellae TaxID=2231787 RepID=A0A365GYW8_9ACTN|nr:PLP-dependent aminotransferase family protein [Actinomadura craniellae]RAY11996.1 PLP-dependent aminotransferase family protein [Actinomadura craniellae]